jgi:hypothetical protein
MSQDADYSLQDFLRIQAVDLGGGQGLTSTR